MPDKAGKMTHRERIWAERFGGTGDAKYAAEKAGYAFPEQSAAKNLQKPEVMELARRETLTRITNEILPLAAQRHVDLLKDPKTQGQTLNRAIEMAYRYGLAEATGGKEKQAHEMTAEELAQAIAVLQRVAADKAAPVIELQANEEPAGVFA